MRSQKTFYPVFFASLWNLFAYPRSGSFVKITNGGVEILSATSPESGEPNDVFAVEKSDFKTDPDSPKRQTPAEIAEAIRSWALKNAIEIERLVDPNPAAKTLKPDRFQAFGTKNNPALNLLRFLNSLEAAELHGISFNGVTLQSLLRRSGIGVE